MNVLFLDQFSALGGAQQCLLDLLPAIAERGWVARAAVPAGGPLVSLLRGRGIPVEELPSGVYRCGRKSFGDVLQFAADVPRQTAAITALLDQAPVDLIYINGPRMLIPAGLAARGRAPILFHAHHVVSQGSARLLEGYALRRSRATVAACCDAVARPLRKWAASLHVIPNGTADLGFVEHSFERRELRVGVIGRIAPEKGQAEFLRAAALLVRDLPHLRFVICGAPLFGDRAYYDEVLRLAAGLPVEFLDWQEDVSAVMRGLDVLVIPSKQEGMPRVLLEAFSAGLPVIAFPVGGIPEVIENEVTGLMTRAAGPAELADTLREALESGSLQEMAHRARREWERRYTLAAYRDGITNLMLQCVPQPGRETAAPRIRRSATQR